MVLLQSRLPRVLLGRNTGRVDDRQSQSTAAAKIDVYSHPFHHYGRLYGSVEFKFTSVIFILFYFIYF